MSQFNYTFKPVLSPLEADLETKSGRKRKREDSEFESEKPGALLPTHIRDLLFSPSGELRLDDLDAVFQAVCKACEHKRGQEEFRTLVREVFKAVLACDDRPGTVAALLHRFAHVQYPTALFSFIGYAGTDDLAIAAVKELHAALTAGAGGLPQGHRNAFADHLLTCHDERHSDYFLRLLVYWSRGDGDAALLARVLDAQDWKARQREPVCLMLAEPPGREPYLNHGDPFDDEIEHLQSLGQGLERVTAMAAAHSPQSARAPVRGPQR